MDNVNNVKIFINNIKITGFFNLNLSANIEWRLLCVWMEPLYNRTRFGRARSKLKIYDSLGKQHVYYQQHFLGQNQCRAAVMQKK